MTRYVSVPAREGFPEAELFVRMSSPSDHQATEIDRTCPTVMFLPTLWTDSFFFYPQFDDPTFFEHFNLVALDFRGYGMSKSGEMQDEYDWRAAADDILSVMAALNIPSAHLIAVTFASNAALHFASSYPERTESLCLITPPQKEEPFLWTMAFDDCRTAMLRALEQNDPDSLDDITLAAWEFSAGSFQSPALAELRDETMQLARTKMSNGDMRVSAPYLDSLLQARLPNFERSIPSTIACPVLVLYGTEDGCQSPDEDDTLIADINANSHPYARAALQVLEGLRRWMTLTSSNIVNPILTSFISSPVSESLPLSPDTPTFSRSITRRPSTPRSASGFVTPMLPKSPLRFNMTPSVVTSHTTAGGGEGKGREMAGNTLSEGVRMTVEVEVVTDN